MRVHHVLVVGWLLVSMIPTHAIGQGQRERNSRARFAEMEARLGRLQGLVEGMIQRLDQQAVERDRDAGGGRRAPRAEKARGEVAALLARVRSLEQRIDRLSKGARKGVDGTQRHMPSHPDADSRGMVPMSKAGDERLKVENARLTARVARLEKMLASRDAERRDLEKQRSVTETRLAEHRKRVADLEVALREKVSPHAELIAEVTSLRERVAKIARSAARLNKDADLARDLERRMKDGQQKAEARIAGLRKELESQAADRVKLARDRDDLAVRLDRARQEAARHAAAAEAAEAAVREAKAKIERLVARATELEAAHARMRSKEQKSRDSIAVQSSELSSLRKHLATLKGTMEERKAALDSRDAELAELKQMLVEQQKHLERAKALGKRLESLKALNKDLKATVDKLREKKN